MHQGAWADNLDDHNSDHQKAYITMIASVGFHEDIQNSKGMNYRSNTSFWALTSAKIPSGIIEI